MVINPTSSSQEIMSLNLKTETLDERQGNLMEIPSISYAFAPQLQFLNFAAQIYSLVAKHRDKFGREAKYYELEPLVALVNEIVKAFGDPRTIGSLSGSPTFVQVYDKMIDDGFMIAPRLNPESVLAKLTGVLWLYISREGEVSAPLKDVLFHVAKYAQCMFSTARLLAPVSVEQQKRSQIRIVLCRRGDATFRKPYILSNQLEFEGSGKPFYYYAMLANVFRNRPDPSQYNRFLRLTHDDGMSSAGTIPHIEAVSENLSALQLPEACINVDGLPENPAKHSLVSTEHTDCQVFGGKAIGKLRIHLEVPPAKWCSYENTKYFFPDEPKPLQEFEQLEEDKKISVRTFMNDCPPLMAAKGPKELLEGIMDAILGHHAIWKEGWLHRDVNLWNVMLLARPVPRERHELCDGDGSEGDQTGNAFRVGMLSDADLAFKYDHSTSDTGFRQRLGSLPFFSRRLLDRWRESNRGSVHFVADDLESFAWTLLFVVLQITKDQKTTDEEEWYNRLLYATYSPTLGRMVRLQYTITENLRCWAYDEHSPILQHFAPLLNDWFVLARSWKPRSSVLLAETAKDDIRFLERSKSFDEKCYKECLALIRRYLPQISDTWPVAP